VAAGGTATTTRWRSAGSRGPPVMINADAMAALTASAPRTRTKAAGGSTTRAARRGAWSRWAGGDRGLPAKRTGVRLWTRRAARHASGMSVGRLPMVGSCNGGHPLPGPRARGAAGCAVARDARGEKVAGRGWISAGASMTRARARAGGRAAGDRRRGGGGDRRRGGGGDRRRGGGGDRRRGGGGRHGRPPPRRSPPASDSGAYGGGLPPAAERRCRRRRPATAGTAPRPCRAAGATGRRARAAGVPAGGAAAGRAPRRPRVTAAAAAAATSNVGGSVGGRPPPPPPTPPPPPRGAAVAVAPAGGSVG